MIEANETLKLTFKDGKIGVQTSAKCANTGLPEIKSQLFLKQIKYKTSRITIIKYTNKYTIII